MKAKENNTGRGKKLDDGPRWDDRNIYWNWSKNGKADPMIVKDIVKAIVRAAKPEKIILFGSAARGEMGPDSDYDVLVVKGGKFNRHRVTTAIYRALSGAVAVDAIVVTPEDVECYRDSHCVVICPAVREGKVIYEAKTISGE